MTRVIILTIITTSCLIICLISSPIIKQSPEHLLLTAEQQANLSCHHGDSSYPYMYWYQQKNNGGSLELIGMLQYGAPTYEEKFKLRFNITGHATQDGFLVISSISTNDIAVYFCAASEHSHTLPEKP
ncbi:TCR beta variable region [Triplophysa rosa]|nr:TCR beta variable region [Triplophysa rosa]